MTLIHLVIPDRKTTTRPRLRANTNDRDEVRVADGLPGVGGDSGPLRSPRQQPPPTLREAHSMAVYM